jgi:ubiquinone/menaquinone biosynthesis C-methylase UbiE
VNVTIDEQVEGVRRWYDFVADDFQRRYEGSEGEYLQAFEDSIYDRLVKCQGRAILDLGTGGGRYSIRVAPEAREVYGIDISKEMIRIAQGRGSSFNNLHFEVGDARATTFGNDVFDAVVSAGMFEYLADPTPIFAEVRRVLRAGGVFVFSCHLKPVSSWPVRLGRRVVSVVLPFSNPTKATKYASETRLRDALFSKSTHRFSGLKRILYRCGFRRASYRSTFFYIPMIVFFFGARKKRRSLKRLAFVLNLFLGWFPLTKMMGGVMIVKVEK